MVRDWQNKNAYTISRLAGDFDKVHAKCGAEKFYNAVMSNTGVRGNNVNGQFVPDPNGEYYSYDPANANPLTTPAEPGTKKR